MSPVPVDVPLRGRDQELAALLELLDAARAGHGGALAIVADQPGLGRSALLAEAVRNAHGFEIFGMRGVRAESDFPLAALHRLLAPDAIDHRRTALSVCQDVHGLLTGADGPVLCWIDDAHRIDRPSLEALTFAARRLAGQPVTMLFTARIETTSVLELELPCLKLRSLGAADSAQVLRDHAGELPDELSAALVELAVGNPLALSELAGELTPEQCAGQAPPPTALPAGGRLRSGYRCRMRRLSPGARLLTLLAAAEDTGVTVHTLARAAAEAGVELRELNAATAYGVVRVEGDTVQAPSPLVRSAVYADAPVAKRHAVHELLARVLDRPEQQLRRLLHQAAAAERPDPEIVEELARAAAASLPAQAAPAWQRAAELTAAPGLRDERMRAAARAYWLAGQPHRARTLLRRVRADRLRGEIELRTGSPGTAGRVLLEAGDMAALALAGEASDLVGDRRAALVIARRAAALRQPVEPPRTELLRHWLIGMAALFDERPAEAMPSLRTVTRLADVTADPASLLRAAHAALALGAEARAYELAGQAVHSLRERPVEALTPTALWALALAELSLGKFRAATASCAEGLRLAQAAGQDNCAVEHRALLALIAAMRGDRVRAVQYIEAIAEPVNVRGLGRPAALVSWAQACLDLADDRPEEAMAQLELMAEAHPFVRLLAAPQHMEAAVRCEQDAMAATAMVGFASWAMAAESPTQQAILHRCRALLTGDEAHFAEALRLHRKGHSAYELARTELAYGHWLRRDRRPRLARSHLRNALRIFRTYEAEPWAERARAELRAAGDTVKQESHPLETLTPQQQQISRLVAAGATNREIAARLVLSPRTVDHHLRNIFTRLDIRSRVELAALVR
jgi:DNA-binding CsgD family transcriptional regulator